MIPSYTVQYPRCYNDATGSIIIESLNMSMEEKKKYGLNHRVVWSQNIKPEQISKSGKRVFNLKSGYYSFKISGNYNDSNWFDIYITDKSSIVLSDINVLSNNDASVSMRCKIQGGTPPYHVTYGEFVVISESEDVIIPNIDTYNNSYISVTDRENCFTQSLEKIQIGCPTLNYKLVNLQGASFYDHHCDSFIINIIDEIGHKHNFHIYESSNGIKQNLITNILYEDIDLENIKTLSQNSIQYNLSKFIYPGQYIIDIFNEHNCQLTTKEIIIKNSDPLSIDVLCKNDNETTSYEYNSTVFIYDTILIPYSILLKDNNILTWIKNINAINVVDIFIDNVTYPTQLNKISCTDYTVDNKIKIIQLDQNPSQWFVKLNIAKGFNLNNHKNIFLSNIKISINNQLYPITLDMTDDTCIKLIRSNLITNSLHSNQLTNIDTARVSCPTLENIYTGQISFFHFHYIYTIGSCMLIDILSNIPNILYDLDLNNPTPNPLINNEDTYIKLAKNFLYTINDINMPIFIKGEKSLSHSGYIIIKPNNKFYEISSELQYIYYNPITKTKYITEFNGMVLNNLSDGLYIIRITNQTKEKLKIINDISYDIHYEASINYLKNTLNLSDDIDYRYGDILLVLYKDYINLDNIPGLTYNKSHISNNISVTQQTHTNRSKPMISDYQLEIIPNNNIQFYIIGPNNFKHIATGHTRLNNLSIGEYIITGDDTLLKEKHLNNSTQRVFIDGAKPKSIQLKFHSCSNNMFILNKQNLES